MTVQFVLTCDDMPPATKVEMDAYIREGQKRLSEANPGGHD